MALFAPRTERLLGKLMQQLLLWTFLPIRAIPSAARALHPRVLLGISNLGPVLSLQLDFFFFSSREHKEMQQKCILTDRHFFSPTNWSYPLITLLAVMAVLNIDLLRLQVHTSEHSHAFLEAKGIQVQTLELLYISTDLNAVFESN